MCSSDLRQAGWERTSYLAMACLLTFEYCELSFSNFYFAAIMLIFGAVLQLGNEVSIVNALELVFMPDPATHLPHQVEYFWVRPFLAVTCERPAEGAYPQQKRWSFGKCLFLWVRLCLPPSQRRHSPDVEQSRYYSLFYNMSVQLSSLTLSLPHLHSEQMQSVRIKWTT